MMLIKKCDLQMIKIDKIEGISKQGKPYLFYTGKFMDSDGEQVSMKLGNNIANDAKVIKDLMAVKNIPVTVDVNIYSSGFVLKGSVSAIDY